MRCSLHSAKLAWIQKRGPSLEGTNFRFPVNLPECFIEAWILGNIIQSESGNPDPTSHCLNPVVFQSSTMR